ncbi:glucosyl-dolichyl phosphate glucuronosyltransferase [Halohasta litorea]|uniref:Glucosyl-dolichyl phosphate glucuronosyltransferase n=1 Tax=Halohasta litorea TaxID=869891 RepID=A0ABD6D9X6_9EURY|nr:glucosyl-dolichyl phosphate glucuronosyltransferase [Halohasta litorea]
MHVSVVLCTYAEDMYNHFREAADSILSQTYGSVELVVIVDGTEAVYDQVVADYGTRDDVVIQCNEENIGLLESRNRGASVASGDVVAFIDDDAVADERWIERLVRAYKDEEAIAAGGSMTPLWVAGKPSFLPEEFHWLIGVTHRGFAEEPGEVRNTFGSNISFRADVFEALDGFDTDIGGRKGDRNLQGGETELCARLHDQYGRGVWYEPEAEVGHKVFDYRTRPEWLLQRAFWQGYSKRAMEVLVPESNTEESAYLVDLLVRHMPARLSNAIRGPSLIEATKLLMLFVFTSCVGLGYLYAFTQWR